MASHEIIEVAESPNLNQGISLWRNPSLYIRSSIKERTLHIKKNTSLSELSGSLGDLGTLLPILVALSITGQISLTASLIFGGLWNITSAIAAVAISIQLSIGEVMSAGIGVGSMIFILGITRTIKIIEKWTPIPIVRGIQLGAGMILIIKAVELVRKSGSWGGSSWKWNDNYEWAMLSFIFVFTFYSSKKTPTALILFVFGLIIAFIKVFESGSTLPSASFNYPEIVVPTLEEFKTGFLSASLGQLPLTALNSVIALSVLANDLFPERSSLNTVEKISISVGLMNIIGCFFGSVPYCHGSGGLAGQYRFGARSEKNFALVIVTAGLLVGFQNDGIGYIGGMLNAFGLTHR
ncbi:2509_t:CDS:2 [Entrophospora sp. SA101]|nr:2509_t:CDS:2 [Entrophospora sp. SA101]